MIVKLSKNHFDYLDYGLFEEQQTLRLKLQIRKEGQYVFVELDEETADEIRDWANEELQRVGFDKNYEITPEGKILEELIDTFYIG